MYAKYTKIKTADMLQEEKGGYGDTPSNQMNG